MTGLEYAIQMEVDGEKFYRELAAKNKDNNLKPVFLSLAEDEKVHAEIIKEKQLGGDYSVDQESLKKVENVFSEGPELFTEKNTADQISAYRLALDMEKKSIDLYKELLTQAKENKELFTFLIKQEEDHYRLIEEIIEMVMRPSEWIESAEFGLRKEY